ncbi:hypothetical protein L6164_027638 [Bauhinia variegata]|nr:hypothetical protein L6164_027638 [Bauhinia variegata]
MAFSQFPYGQQVETLVLDFLLTIQPIRTHLFQKDGTMGTGCVTVASIMTHHVHSLCKKCNAFPSALGTKRLASEELVDDWDSKRLNIGYTNEQQQSYRNFEQVVGTSENQKPGTFPSYPGINSSAASSLPQDATLALLGRG